MNLIFITLSAFLKSSTSRIFLLLLILLGILLSFMHNDHLTKKTKANSFVKDNNRKIYNDKNFSKVDNSNKLLKLVFNTDDKIKDAYFPNIKRQFIPNNYSYIKSNAQNSPIKSLTYNSNDSSSGFNNIANNTPASGSAGSSTGGAVPAPYSNAYYYHLAIFTSSSPMVSRTVTNANKIKFSPPHPQPPEPVPIPEPSSIILSLIGLSGLLGFRKKIC